MYVSGSDLIEKEKWIFKQGFSVASVQVLIYAVPLACAGSPSLTLIINIINYYSYLFLSVKGTEMSYQLGAIWSDDC